MTLPGSFNDLFYLIVHSVNSSESCDSSVDAFPASPLNNNPPNWTVLVFGIIISAYIFWAIGVCCTRYLVPSVESLCDKFNIPYDIGGATFLAFSTSAPELFACIVGTFLTKSDFGISTIIGSCIFNSLLIPGICGVFCKETLTLDWFSVTRDNVWYFISTITVSIAIHDEIVDLMECIALIILYIIMLIFLTFDKRVRKCCNASNADITNEEVTEEKTDEEVQKKYLDIIWGYPKNKSCFQIFIWCLTRPFCWLFAFTVPMAHVSFVGAFIGSVIWLAILCYLASWSIKLVGFHLLVPDGVMGVTLMAAGTSIPEIVSSFIVSRKGQGAMAISNAVGSNTFNNLVALTVPWITCILIKGRSITLDSMGMTFVTGSVLFTVFFLQFTFLLTRYRLGKVFGWICVMVYVIFSSICVGLIIYFCRK